MNIFQKKNKFHVQRSIQIAQPFLWYIPFILVNSSIVSHMSISTLKLSKISISQIKKDLLSLLLKCCLIMAIFAKSLFQTLTKSKTLVEKLIFMYQVLFQENLQIPNMFNYIFKAFLLNGPLWEELSPLNTIYKYLLILNVKQT